MNFLDGFVGFKKRLFLILRYPLSILWVVVVVISILTTDNVERLILFTFATLFSTALFIKGYRRALPWISYLSVNLLSRINFNLRPASSCHEPSSRK